MKKFIDIFIHELGFDSQDHLIRTVFGWKSAHLLLAQIGGSALTVVVSIIEDWIWSPASGVVVFAVLVLTESFTGVWVAVKIKDEKFDFRKFYNIAPKLLAHVLLLALAYNISHYSMIMVWLPNACFGWFATRNFIATLLNLIQMKLVKGEFAEYIMKRLAIDQKDLAESLKKEIEK
jgi:hypothetical protein